MADVKLLQVTEELLREMRDGGDVYIKGAESPAVLTTATQTFQMKQVLCLLHPSLLAIQVETSNSLLLFRHPANFSDREQASVVCSLQEILEVPSHILPYFCN